MATARVLRFPTKTPPHLKEGSSRYELQTIVVDLRRKEDPSPSTLLSGLVKVCTAKEATYGADIRSSTFPDELEHCHGRANDSGPHLWTQKAPPKIPEFVDELHALS